ncbi:MAG: aldehyde dehydrogenase family protein [Ilumatobacteraceae bacterium]
MTRNPDRDDVSRPGSTPTDVAATVAAMRDAAGSLDMLDRRRDALRRLRDLLVDATDTLSNALADDLGKSATEAWTTEIGFTIGQIDHIERSLDRWSRPRRVRLPMTLRPGRARVVPTPLGTVCIIAPWNYPIQLTLAPLAAALAAGNTAVVKPSEVAPATEALLARLLGERLPDVVGVVTGGVDTATELLRHRFDHIFYTGNGRVGRVVMRAAAEHLTPVTLELGGKSPAIVTGSADVAVAARRIAWGKFVNAGQTCVAPDHVLVERHLEDRLVSALRAEIDRFTGGDPAASPDFGRIVNVHHHDRLSRFIDGSDPTNGVTVVGGGHDRDTLHIDPTVLVGTARTSPVMDEEIFGPILPIIPVDDLDDAIDVVRSRPHPLALYLFSTDDEERRQVLRDTHSGALVVNHALLHLAVEDLPFGGVGESGMGAYHGRTGFDTFSHLRPVLERPNRPDPRLLYPPYGPWKRRILRRLL